jgi:hypothetical protein
MRTSLPQTIVVDAEGFEPVGTLVADVCCPCRVPDIGVDCFPPPLEHADTHRTRAAKATTNGFVVI